MMKVAVFSCDKYLWLKPIFLHFYRKNWPDNPYQTEFVTETKKIEGMTTFCVGKIPWADIAIKYLKSLNEETLLLLLDDFILNEPVDTDRVKRAEGLCAGDIGCVRLQAHDQWSCFLFDSRIKGFKEYPLNKRYCVSLQASIWQKKFLFEFLKEGETCWQTESQGSRRIFNSKYRVIWADTAILSYWPGGYMRRRRINEHVAKWVKENW